MSTPSPTPPVPAPVTAPIPAPAGVKPPVPTGAQPFNAMEYTGLPPSLVKKVAAWRKWAKIPGPKMSVFLLVTGATGYMYYYDRQEVARLKKEYKEKVEALSKIPLGNSLEYGRKVKVYAGKWPEDDDYERGMLHFRKYVKPYLVAAAIDYEMITSPQYGSTTRHLHGAINTRRRVALGLEQLPVEMMSGRPGELSPEQKQERDVQGGVFVVGRHTLKEYTEGLKEGWLGGVEKFDREKQVQRMLEGDGVFETKEQLEEEKQRLAAVQAQAMPIAPEPSTSRSTSGFGKIGAINFMNKRSAAASPAPTSVTSGPDGADSAIAAYLHTPPSPLPPTPPIALVPWTNHLGFKQIPYMMAGWFTERFIVREGAEATMKLILGQIRPLEPATDLTFDVESESFYKKNFKDTPQRIAKNRETYYKELENRLNTARELAAGTREPTKEETEKPPITEQQLREERLKKEIRWRNEEEGFEIIKPGSEPAWDSRFEGWLKVYDHAEGYQAPMPSPW